MGQQPLYRVEFVDGHSVTSWTSKSVVLRPDEYHPDTEPHIISSAVAGDWGRSDASETFKVGNGGLGPTGLLKRLYDHYLLSHPSLRIIWIANHSRHSQAALEASIVDLALTYEPEEEEKAECEGWSRRMGLLCYDHFVIAGPTSDPAGLHKLGLDQKRDSPSLAASAFKAIACTRSTFHTRGDGSATMHRELSLWSASGVDPRGSPWFHRIPCTPLEALAGAAKDNAYLLTDRATFLSAYNGGLTDNLEVFVQGGSELLNPCSIQIRTDETRAELLKLVHWMRGHEAQGIIESFGKDLRSGLPLVSRATQVEMAAKDELRQLPSHNVGSLSEMVAAL